jgi:fumarylpyruvate hydrolase
MVPVLTVSFAFAPPQPVSLPIKNSAARFPVSRIFCIGRNYTDHAREMGHEPTLDPPFFFMKPADAAIEAGVAFPYPAQSQDVHHEVELVVALQKGGTTLSSDAALDAIFGYAVGLDMTRRDLQAEAKRVQRPWEVAKAFASSAPIGRITPAHELAAVPQGRIALTVNGSLKQQGLISDMIWNVADLISHISQFFTLMPGDMIMTGTPAGVGAIKPGDEMLATIDGLEPLMVEVKA